MAHGGKRDGAGRKSKAEEFGLTEKMDSTGKTIDVLKRVYELATDDNPKMAGVSLEAAKLWLSYRLGKPQENLDVTSGGEIIAIRFKDAE
jgi:hypothetical protein